MGLVWACPAQNAFRTTWYGTPNGPKRWVSHLPFEKIQAFVEAEYDHVYVHQVGLDQEDFSRFYNQEILPKLR